MATSVHILFVHRVHRGMLFYSSSWNCYWNTKHTLWALIVSLESNNKQVKQHTAEANTLTLLLLCVCFLLKLLLNDAPENKPFTNVLLILAHALLEKIALHQRHVGDLYWKVFKDMLFRRIEHKHKAEWHSVERKVITNAMLVFCK